MPSGRAYPDYAAPPPFSRPNFDWGRPSTFGQPTSASAQNRQPRNSYGDYYGTYRSEREDAREREEEEEMRRTNPDPESCTDTPLYDTFSARKSMYDDQNSPFAKVKEPNPDFSPFRDTPPRRPSSNTYSKPVPSEDRDHSYGFSFQDREPRSYSHKEPNFQGSSSKSRSFQDGAPHRDSSDVTPECEESSSRNSSFQEQDPHNHSYMSSEAEGLSSENSSFQDQEPRRQSYVGSESESGSESGSEAEVLFSRKPKPSESQGADQPAASGPPASEPPRYGRANTTPTIDDFSNIFTGFEDSTIDYTDARKREYKAGKMHKENDVDESLESQADEKDNSENVKQAVCTEHIPFEDFREQMARDAAAAAEQRRLDAAREEAIIMAATDIYRKKSFFQKSKVSALKKIKNLRARLSELVSTSSDNVMVPKSCLRSKINRRLWVKNGCSGDWDVKVVELPKNLDDWRNQARQAHLALKRAADEDRKRTYINLNAAIDHSAVLCRRQVECSGKLALETLRVNREFEEHNYGTEDVFYFLNHDFQVNQCKIELSSLLNQLDAIKSDIARWEKTLEKIDITYEKKFTTARLANAKEACEFGESNIELNFAASVHPARREICMDFWREIAAVSEEEALNPTELQKFVLEKYSEWLEVDTKDGTIKASLLDSFYYPEIDPELLEIGGCNFGGYGLRSGDDHQTSGAAQACDSPQPSSST